MAMRERKKREHCCGTPTWLPVGRSAFLFLMAPRQMPPRAYTYNLPWCHMAWLWLGKGGWVRWEIDEVLASAREEGGMVGGPRTFSLPGKTREGMRVVPSDMVGCICKTSKQTPAPLGVGPLDQCRGLPLGRGEVIAYSAVFTQKYTIWGVLAFHTKTHPQPSTQACDTLPNHQ